VADDKQKSVVDVARARYQRAKDVLGTLRQQAIDDTRFALGDSDNQWQWPEDVYTNRAAVSGKPCLTINVTAQHCNQIINAIRQNRPSAKISPVDGQADKKTALILGGMLRSIQAYSNADTAHDIAAEHAVYGGEGFWRVLTEYESDDSFDQVICIKPLINPQLVYIDPDAIEPDRSDAKWGMIFEDLSKEQFREEYPDLDVSSWVEDAQGWNKQDQVRRAEYFYCETEPDTLLKLADGTVLRSSALQGVKRYGQMLVTPDGQQVAIVAERETSKKVWYWCKLIGGEAEPVDKRVWPGQYLPIITVVGKEINVNGELVRKGIVRDLKDSGRMVNYSYSAAVETVALQNKVPYLASAEAIAGFEDIWGAANIENRAYLPYNERDMEGNALMMPQRQAPATMATAQVQMLQLSVEQMRASSGQQNANFGIRSEAASGVGIQRLKAQGEVATFHFPDNLARALKYEAKVIIDLIPKLYDTRRVVRILGMDGKESAAVLDPDMNEPHAELNETADSEVKEAFNPSVGRYDVAIDTGPSYQTQRQEAADALTSLTQSNPQIMQVAGDIVMRSYDFPMAEELAQRLAKTLPPGLQEHEGQQEVPPQVQQAMQQMGQQMDALTQELHASADKLQELQEGAEIKTQELSIKAYDAETKRIQVLGTAMGPEQVQALVMQTLQAALTTPAPGPQIYEDMQEMEQEEAQHPEMQEGMPQGAPPGMPPDMPPDPQAMPPEQNPPPAGFFTPDQSTQGQP
jgi:hypothetical protein